MFVVCDEMAQCRHGMHHGMPDHLALIPHEQRNVVCGRDDSQHDLNDDGPYYVRYPFHMPALSRLVVPALPSMSAVQAPTAGLLLPT